MLRSAFLLIGKKAVGSSPSSHMFLRLLEEQTDVATLVPKTPVLLSALFGPHSFRNPLENVEIPFECRSRILKVILFDAMSLYCLGESKYKITVHLVCHVLPGLRPCDQLRSVWSTMAARRTFISRSGEGYTLS